MEDFMRKNYFNGFMVPMWIACLFFITGIVYANNDYHGNTCATATLVDINSTTFGMINSAGDVDVFRIDIPAPGASLIVSTKSKIDLSGILKDSNCKLIEEDDDSGELFNFKIGPKLLNEGTYYVLIRHFSQHGTGGYEFHVKSDPVIDFTYSTKISWEEYHQVTRGVKTSCRGTKWPECSSRKCEATGIIQVPFEQEVTLVADHNSSRRCMDKKKRYKIDDGEWIGTSGTAKVNVKQQVELYVYGKTCHNWNCCHEECSVWVNATLIEKSDDKENISENFEGSLQINTVQVINTIPIPEPVENGVNKNLSCVATTDNPNVKLYCQQEEDHFDIYASATIKKNLLLDLDLSAESSVMKPTINIIAYPDYGNRFKNLNGTVQNIENSEYSVMVLIYTDTWEIKPYKHRPLTPIREDGSWECDITTNGSDHQASKIAAFVVPSDFQLTINDNTFHNIPEEIADASIANAIIKR